MNIIYRPVGHGKVQRINVGDADIKALIVAIVAKTDGFLVSYQGTNWWVNRVNKHGTPPGTYRKIKVGKHPYETAEFIEHDGNPFDFMDGTVKAAPVEVESKPKKARKSRKKVDNA